MFERPSLVSSGKQGGTARRCERAKPDGVGECLSGPDERFDIPLSEAADLFVKSQTHPGASSQLEIADWLALSPCHECAWRRVCAAWDVLPTLL
jgi:hypothetical protein